MSYTAKVGLRPPRSRPRLGLFQVLPPELTPEQAAARRYQELSLWRQSRGLMQPVQSTWESYGLPQETPDPTPDFDPRANLVAAMEYAKRVHPIFQPGFKEEMEAKRIELEAKMDELGWTYDGCDCGCGCDCEVELTAPRVLFPCGHERDEQTTSHTCAEGTYT